MVDLVYCSTDLLFLYILLLYYYINLISSIICCVFSGDIYLFLGVSVSLSTASNVNCGDLFKTFVILLAILLPINSAVASAIF